MIFQKPTAKIALENNEELADNYAPVNDEVETVVGPSVNVEGDFASEGNIIVKGSVAGSVHTSKFLSVEVGAKILANVRAGSAKVAGMGDIEAKTLIIEAGALLFGKVSMPGLEAGEKVTRSRGFGKKTEEVEPSV